MTYPVIESSRYVAFVVARSEKTAMFSGIRAGDSGVPATKVNLVVKSSGSSIGWPPAFDVPNASAPGPWATIEGVFERHE